MPLIIYKSERKTEIAEFYDKAKKHQVGPTSYNPVMVKEKVKGCQEKGSRITFQEEIMTTGNNLLFPPPGNYKMLDLNKYQLVEKPRFPKIHAESDF